MVGRRSFLMGASAALGPASWAAAAEPSVSDNEILIGQSAVLSGPLGSGGLALQGGVRLALEEINARGGIAERKLRLHALDDAFDPTKAQANYQMLAAQSKALACVCGTGAAQTLAGLPALREHGVPLVGAVSVPDSARDKTQGTAYYTRASQQREAQGLVQHLHTLGMQRIAVAHFATAGGREVLSQVQAALTQRGMPAAGAVELVLDGSDASQAAKALVQLKPQAVILHLSGAPAAGLMKSVWEHGGAPSFYGMSILAGEVIARLLGQQTRGLAISQVMPFPWDAATPDAIQYRRAAEKAQTPIGYHSYEGYLTGRLLIEALKPIGRELTRAKLNASLQRLKTRIAGVDFDFSGGRHTGSTFIELVQVRYDGKFVR